ncbi:hypothetical protein GGD38_004456 [Chitinophagaceae bacterium OAS944]|nr:hypothetical protein [Chitinophagaceae bacterium OAS944]
MNSCLLPEDNIYYFGSALITLIPKYLYDYQKFNYPCPAIRVFTKCI